MATSSKHCPESTRFGSVDGVGAGVASGEELKRLETALSAESKTPDEGLGVGLVDISGVTVGMSEETTCSSTTGVLTAAELLTSEETTCSSTSGVLTAAESLTSGETTCSSTSGVLATAESLTSGETTCSSTTGVLSAGVALVSTVALGVDIASSARTTDGPTALKRRVKA